MKKEFSYNNVNKKEVNELIDYVIEKSKGIIDLCEEQRKRIEELENELDYYKKMDFLNNKKEEIIIEEAKVNASRILNEALIKANELEMKRKLFKNNVKSLKNKLSNLIDEIDNYE